MLLGVPRRVERRRRAARARAVPVPHAIRARRLPRPVAAAAGRQEVSEGRTYRLNHALSPITRSMDPSSDLAHSG